MSRNVKLKNICHHLPDALDAWIAELEQMMTLLTDQVIMLPETVGPFVFGLLVAELMPDNQVAIN